MDNEIQQGTVIKDAPPTMRQKWNHWRDTYKTEIRVLGTMSLFTCLTFYGLNKFFK